MKRDAHTFNDVRVFAENFKDCNQYTTVYGYKEPYNYQSAVIDRVFFEFDAADGVFDDTLLKDVRKVLTWMRDYTDLDPQLFFSGSRGIHVVVYFDPVDLINPSPCIYKFIGNVAQLTKSQFLDMNARHGVTQMRRVPGSRHQKTGLFCIPLSFGEVMTMSAEQIKKLAQKNRDTWFDVEKSKTLSNALKRIDERIEYNKMRARLKPTKKVEIPNECIAVEEVREGVDYGNRDFALVGLIHYLRNNGTSYDDTLAHLKYEWLPKNDPKYGDEQWVEYKVKYHYPRKGLPCNWWKKAKVPLCEGCPLNVS